MKAFEGRESDPTIARRADWSSSRRREARNCVTDPSPPESPLSCQESTNKREEHGFAQSTIEATVWLICHQPARLPAWFARHPNGKTLEKIARAKITLTNEVSE